MTTSAAPSVAQASCYFGYVIAVHRTLLKLGEYLSNSCLRLVSISQTPTQVGWTSLKSHTIDLIIQHLNMAHQEKSTKFCITLTSLWSLPYSGCSQPGARPIYRTGTPQPSKHPNLYIFSPNIRTEFFKHAANSPFFSLQNAVYFIMLPFLFPVLFTFCIQGVLKFKYQIPVLKG